MAPVVSVVIPVFNGLPHLKDALDSVLAQDYPDVEVVLTDGGSTDGSREWLRTIDDPRVRVFESPERTSAAENWTECSRLATGAYVKLLCQDDLLAPDALTRQVSDLERHPDALMAVAQRDIVDVRGRVLYQRRGCAGLPDGLVAGTTALAASYGQGTNVFGEPVAVLFRRAVLDAALPWNDAQPFLLDLELYTRILEQGPLVVRRESIGAFRVSESSWSTQLIHTQVEQMRGWQHDFEEKQRPALGRATRTAARLHLRRQALLRRGAYRVLRMRGAFTS